MHRVYGACARNVCSFDCHFVEHLALRVETCFSFSHAMIRSERTTGSVEIC